MPNPEPNNVPLNLRVPEDVKTDFQVWCIRNKREMTEVLIGCMRQVLSGKLKVPPKPRAKPKPSR